MKNYRCKVLGIVIINLAFKINIVELKGRLSLHRKKKGFLLAYSLIQTTMYMFVTEFHLKCSCFWDVNKMFDKYDSLMGGGLLTS